MKEKQILSEWIEHLPKNVIDLTGKFTLAELIAFLTKADGLVAASTGPLHIAAAVGIHTLGLYPDKRPIHAGRWAPIGPKAFTLSSNSAHLESISPADVTKVINGWNKV
jgi:ADP-heptose:LPS heptosyltransferase